MIVNIHYGEKVKSTNYNNATSNLSDIGRPIIRKNINIPIKIGTLIVSSLSYVPIVLGATDINASPEGIRQSFSKIIDVFTAISEPILWGYAIIGLVLVATGNKQVGWSRVKQVAYAYIGINCLPAFFAFLRYIAKMLTASFS